MHHFTHKPCALPSLLSCTHQASTPAVLQKVLGLNIVWKHPERLPAERHVLVSNHVTAGDLMVLYSLPQHYVHLISAQLPKRISQVQQCSHLCIKLKSDHAHMQHRQCAVLHEMTEELSSMHVVGHHRSCPRHLTQVTWAHLHMHCIWHAMTILACCKTCSSYLKVWQACNSCECESHRSYTTRESFAGKAPQSQTLARYQRGV